MISNQSIIGVAVTEAYQALADQSDGWLKRAQAARARWSYQFRNGDPGLESVRPMLNRAEHLMDAAISHRLDCSCFVTEAGAWLMWPPGGKY